MSAVAHVAGDPDVDPDFDPTGPVPAPTKRISALSTKSKATGSS